jgi:hypothetical protein
MMQVVEHLLQKLFLEIHTDTSKELSILSPLKECTQASLSTAEPKVGFNSINLILNYIILIIASLSIGNILPVN